jgi:hypothetical protein
MRQLQLLVTLKLSDVPDDADKLEVGNPASLLRAAFVHDEAFGELDVSAVEIVDTERHRYMCIDCEKLL